MTLLGLPRCRYGCHSLHCIGEAGQEASWTRIACKDRMRHKKCDEARPICGACAIASRDCLFPADIRPGEEDTGSQHPRNAPSRTTEPYLFDRIAGIESRDRGLGELRSVLEPPTTSQQNLMRSPGSTPLEAGQLQQQSHSQSLDAIAQNRDSGVLCASTESNSISGSGSAYAYAYSPEIISPEPWTVDTALTRWLGLLATDAAQADSTFSLAPSPAPDGQSPGRPQRRLSDLADPERKTWQADRDITLSDHEAGLFRFFAERSASWLDALDSNRRFSTYAVRLALRNTGLMKATLALAAKHRLSANHEAIAHDPSVPGWEHNSDGAVQYYYETLHYVQEALVYNSYTQSEELLATAIVISAYEMLDESDGRGNWQRHLKGVFWIQRSQNVNGASGGLRQSVWWAWLRQDLWAAFRERRRCFSFWKPIKDYSEMDQHELADYSIYLLSQAVNYCADCRAMDDADHAADPVASTRRIRVGDDLLAKLAWWKSFLGDEYKPLPTVKDPSAIIAPLWVHPPKFGLSLQAYSFARILVILHRTMPSSLDGYLKMQRNLTEAVDTICGIAMELHDEGCQILSAQCLYGAGLCVQDHHRRERIISLIESCEARAGWAPMATWRADLRQEWAKADGQDAASGH